MTSFVKDYNKFDVHLYLEPRYTKPVKLWCFKKLHTFWQQFGSKKNIKLLEFGGGPNISRLISACPCVTDIVFSEYIDSIRKAVEDWVENKGFDWKGTFDFVVKQLEEKDERASNLRQEELRKKIKAIIPCDITANEVLDTSSLPANLQPPYDVVFTSYCLEAVVESNQEYKDSVSKLFKLVKPGGFLVMHGGLGSTFYCVGKCQYYTFSLHEEIIIESLQAAGFADIVFDDNKNKLSSGDASGEFFVIGKKK